MSDKKFVLEITAEQGEVLVRALDFFSRIGIGQISEVWNLLHMESHVRDEASHDAVRNALDFVKRELLGLESGASFGIFNGKVPEHYKTAWDLQQVIRHVLAWDANPKGGFGVNFHEPLKSAKHGLATMKISEEWLRDMAEKEGNGIISVGGLVTRMKEANDPAVNPDA